MRGVKKAEKKAMQDPEYYKATVKLFALESKGKTNDAEIMKREEEFKQKTKKLEEDKNAEYDEMLQKVREEKAALQTEMEEKKSFISHEIETEMQIYEELLIKSLKDKETLCKAQRLQEELLAKKAKFSKLEKRIDENVYFSFRSRIDYQPI